MSNLIALQCPHCQAALEINVNAKEFICTSCQQQLNVPAQWAYARAEAAFLAAEPGSTRRILNEVGGHTYRPKTRLNLSPLKPETLNAYQQAYSGLSIAFDYDLPESQQYAGIEMMAVITSVFARQAMVSPLEAEYWAKLMIEKTVRRELQALQAGQAASPRGGLLYFFRRWRGHVRQRQLCGVLAKLAVRIAELEGAIGFLSPPHVR